MPALRRLEYSLGLLQAYRQEIATLDEEIYERTQQREKLTQESHKILQRMQARKDDIVRSKAILSTITP